MVEKELSDWLIKQLRLRVPVAEAEAVAIAALFSCRKIRKGEVLLQEGHYGDWWGFIYSGLLRSYSCDAAGTEYTNGFISEASFTCELVSFNGTAGSPTAVEALEETLLLCVDKHTLDFLFEHFRVFERLGRLLCETSFIQYKRHTLLRVRCNARERYLHFLADRPELLHRVPLKHIASYLNITDTSLSRIRRNRK